MNAYHPFNPTSNLRYHCAFRRFAGAATRRTWSAREFPPPESIPERVPIGPALAIVAGPMRPLAIRSVRDMAVLTSHLSVSIRPTRYYSRATRGSVQYGSPIWPKLLMQLGGGDYGVGLVEVGKVLTSKMTPLCRTKNSNTLRVLVIQRSGRSISFEGT